MLKDLFKYIPYTFRNVREKCSSTMFNIYRNCSFNTAESILRRDEFMKKFEEIKSAVELLILSEKEKEIYEIHKEAVQKGKLSYTDPTTGYLVMTGLYHFVRGYCCGNGCRHCPYNHERAPPHIKIRRKFNSAFYVKVSPREDEDK
ncbi:uncharacterized protein C1orf53-like isoform X1 [Tachypleus tridentatus]|uniref:uncharacterized protein C1orf53-like isoform X1 n=2 Tax=Tachypleus tridentatus TaxID=6853 RepID=UPI003FD558F2